MTRLRTIFSVLTLVIAPGFAWAEDTVIEPPHAPCFSLHDWQGWKSPQPDQLLFRVHLHDVYLIELNDNNSWLNAPGMHLVTKVRGSDMICSPIDLDLGLADERMFREHLFIKSIRKLNPEEIAAIKPEFKP